MRIQIGLPGLEQAIDHLEVYTHALVSVERAIKLI